MIYKSPRWVGADAQGLNGYKDSNGLKMMRRYETFEGNRENEYIKVVYTQWMETEDGKQYDLKWREYFVKDIPARETILDDSDNIVIQGHIAYLNFTSWYNQLGATYIIPAIDHTLISMPFDCKDSYLTHPDNIDI